MEETESKSHWREFKKPVNYIGLIIGVLGIVLFFWSLRDKELSYADIGPASLVFDIRNEWSTVKLVENDSSIVRGQVWIRQYKIVNSGDLPIDSIDVRRFPIFKLHCERIIEFGQVNEFDAEIEDYQITQIGNQELQITWDHLDPDHEIVFQILYVGNEQSEFELSANISEILEFKKRESRDEFWWKLPILILGTLVWSFAYDYAKNIARKKGLMTLAIVSIIFIIGGFLLYYFFFRPE